MSAGTLVVSAFTGHGDEWDAFGRAQLGWTAFHRLAWRDVISGVHGRECPYLCVRDSHGTLRGILPLVHLKSAVFGHYLVSTPYVNYGGPLGDDAGITALCD